MTGDQETIIRKRNENIGKLFKLAARDFSGRALVKLRERGYPDLTPFHTELISNLDVEGTRISILAERAGMSKQAMGQIVSQLEKHGIILRTPDPADGRATLIRFTDTGWDFLRTAYDVKNEIEAEYTAIIGTNGMDSLRQLLDAILSSETPEMKHPNDPTAE
ncbi:MAG: MarR family transcriptional regulator [Chloroflexota bacterium]